MKTALFVKSTILAIVLAAAAPSLAYADSTVNVSLQDRGGAMQMDGKMMLGMGMKGNMMDATMSIKIDQATVKAGPVTFKVTNDSKETQHEMLISPITSEDSILPYIDNENRVDEEKSGDLGEVSELDPGKSGALTLDLKPGLYILYCNVPGHYMAGMWTTLKVE